MWPAKPKVFTIWTFIENICQSLYYEFQEMLFLSQRVWTFLKLLLQSAKLPTRNIEAIYVLLSTELGYLPFILPQRSLSQIVSYEYSFSPSKLDGALSSFHFP